MQMFTRVGRKRTIPHLVVCCGVCPYSHTRSNVSRHEQVERTKTERRVLEVAAGCEFIMTMSFAFQTEARLYIVLEYCGGGELFFHLSRSVSSGCSLCVCVCLVCVLVCEGGRPAVTHSVRVGRVGGVGGRWVGSVMESMSLKYLRFILQFCLHSSRLSQVSQVPRACGQVLCS